MPVKVLLADDHKIVREGIHSLLDKQTGMEVVAEAENGHAAVKLAQQLKPDVVIMDISMPDMNGIEATRRIKANAPSVKVLALSIHSHRRFVAEMLRAGASGFLLKDCAFEELAKAIRCAMDDQVYLTPTITGIVIEDYLQRLPSTKTAASVALTSREREVLQLVAEGYTTKEIATRLDLSTRTVDTYRHQVMDKLDIFTVAGLTKYAVREGLTSLEE